MIRSKPLLRSRPLSTATVTSVTTCARVRAPRYVTTPDIEYHGRDSVGITLEQAAAIRDTLPRPRAQAPTKEMTPKLKHEDDGY